MELTAFYREVLNIETPWAVLSAEVNKKEFCISLHLSHAKGSKFPCACCGELSPVYDHQEVRTWRHLDTCQYQTLITAQLPRTSCAQCGIKTVVPSWASPHSRFTIDFECHAIDVLQLCQAIDSSALLLQITADQLSYLMRKTVERGLSRRTAHGGLIDHLAMDEKSYKEGHHYATILTDADQNRVLEVIEDRTIEAVRESYKVLNDNQLAHVKAISMDMWLPFATVAKEQIPQAAIVYDKFHLAQYLNNAVDITRRADNKKYLQNDNQLLKGTKYLWLYNADNMPEKYRTQLEELLKISELKTVKAFQIKEDFKNFFKAQSPEQAREIFQIWFDKANSSENTPLIKVAKMFKVHLDGIVNHITHRISNAIAESINSRIQTLKAKARGFLSTKAFRYAILFHFGKLNLYP